MDVPTAPEGAAVRANGRFGLIAGDRAGALRAIPGAVSSGLASASALDAQRCASTAASGGFPGYLRLPDGTGEPQGPQPRRSIGPACGRIPDPLARSALRLGRGRCPYVRAEAAHRP